MLKVLAGVVACVMVLGSVQAQGTAQTKPDYSEPKAAIRSFLMAQDEAGLRAALIVPPGKQEEVEPLLDVMVATTKLEQAAGKQYGTAAEPFRRAPKQQLDADLKRLDDALVKMNGDSAVVSLPEDKARRQAATDVKLQKVDGQWRIDAISMFKLDAGTRPERERQAAMARTITGVTEQMNKDIEAGKFPSATDAYREYATRTTEALRRASAAATRGQ